jgi:hypothetical protein
MTMVHLHRDDVPDTLALLHALLGDRTHPTPGYTPDETGADVDWDLLGDGYLSISEKAVCTSPTVAPSWNATAAACRSSFVGRSGPPSHRPPNEGCR